MRIYGHHVVLSFLQNKPHLIKKGFISESLNANTKRQMLGLFESAEKPWDVVRAKTLDEWFPNENHQGLALLVQAQGEYQESDLPQIAAVSKRSCFLILDGVQDPHNLGACIRTAEAAGAQAVLIPRHHAAQLTPLVRKIASGAAEVLPVVSVTNLSRSLEWLKKQGVWLVGLDAEAPGSIYELDLKGPLGLVMGAEGSGLRALTKKHCDHLAQIPMLGSVQSLNVSVATGVCLYEALRQRRL